MFDAFLLTSTGYEMAAKSGLGSILTPPKARQRLKEKWLTMTHAEELVFK
jgi:hypothetical protein